MKKRAKIKARPRQKWRAYIIGFSLVIAAWWLLMGVLTLQNGIVEPKICRGAFCIVEDMILRHAGVQAYFRFTVAGYFCMAALFIVIAITRGFLSAPAKRRRRRREQ